MSDGIRGLYTRIHDVAESSVSLPVETSSEWEAWVARPCVDYMLAPREARAALEVLGFFATKGVPIGLMLRQIVAMNESKVRGML